MALNATPKSSSANSFTTREFAADYLTNKRAYAATSWNALTGVQQDTLLIWATTILDASFLWEGVITTRDQALGWPRGAVYDKEDRIVDPQTVPLAIQEATAELAYALSIEDRTKPQEILTKGLKSASLPGGLKIEVDHAFALEMIPGFVEIMVGPLGELQNAASSYGPKVIRLERA